MSGSEIASLCASLVSVGIGILAIWLSLTFYRMSTKLSESTREAAKEIKSSVDRLEKLFDSLYSDTFSMMRDTVADMRKHIWPNEVKSSDSTLKETERRADEKLAELKSKMTDELSTILRMQGRTDAKVEQQSKQLERIVNEGIAESRKVDRESSVEALRENIANQFAKNNGTLMANVVVDELGNRFPTTAILRELRKMKEEGIISWDREKLMPNTIMKLEHRITR